MSKTLLEFAKSFVNSRLSGEQFANSYQELWRIEGEKGLLILDEVKLNECLSTIFCLADNFYPGLERASYELDEVELRIKIKEVINNFDL